jgi:hypothetical protein
VPSGIHLRTDFKISIFQFGDCKTGADGIQSSLELNVAFQILVAGIFEEFQVVVYAELNIFCDVMIQFSVAARESEQLRHLKKFCRLRQHVSGFKSIASSFSSEDNQKHRDKNRFHFFCCLKISRVCRCKVKFGREKEQKAEFYFASAHP